MFISFLLWAPTQAEEPDVPPVQVDQQMKHKFIPQSTV
jgi:hypothetical protein